MGTINHVGGEPVEEVLFHGGPLDGKTRTFIVEHMSETYRPMGTPYIYKLERRANPVRKRRGWIDLHYVYVEQPS